MSFVFFILFVAFGVIAVAGLLLGACYDYRYRRRGERLRVSDAMVRQRPWAITAKSGRGPTDSFRRHAATRLGMRRPGG
jgi:hypothetical protein